MKKILIFLIFTILFSILLLDTTIEKKDISYKDFQAFEDSVKLNFYRKALISKISFYTKDPEVSELIIHGIYVNSKRYRIPFESILALIFAESDFNIEALGPTGEKGLTQITKTVIKLYEDTYKVKIVNEYNISQNISIGCWYLSTKLKIAKNEREAFALYNAGIYWETSGILYFNRIIEKRRIIEKWLNIYKQ